MASDVRSQLRVFDQIDEVERKHRESREREMLMRVAKVIHLHRMSNSHLTCFGHVIGV